MQSQAHYDPGRQARRKDGWCCQSGRNVISGGQTSSLCSAHGRSGRKFLDDSDENLGRSDKCRRSLSKTRRRNISSCLVQSSASRQKQPGMLIHLRGDYADELILDEFQLMNEDIWDAVGAPMLLDNNGDASFHLYTAVPS